MAIAQSTWYDHRVFLIFISELWHILLSKLTTSTYWKRDVAQTSRLTLSLQRSCHIWRRISNYLAIKIRRSVSSQKYMQNIVHVLPKIKTEDFHDKPELRPFQLIRTGTIQRILFIRCAESSINLFGTQTLTPSFVDIWSCGGFYLTTL